MTVGLPIHPESVGNDQVHAPAVKTSPPVLTNAEAKETRRCIMRAAHLGVQLHSRMTYSEAGNRWSGVVLKARSIKQQVPPYCDCSAFATWCYWDATRWLDLPDVVNGEDWTAGYTGTMIEHGKQIDGRTAQLGDLMFYGQIDAPYHVAVFAGDGLVVSMGRPGAPELVGVGDASMCRSYL